MKFFQKRFVVVLGSILAVALLALVVWSLKERLISAAYLRSKPDLALDSISFNNNAERQNGPFDRPIDIRSLEESIKEAAHYLVKACDEDGKFVYRVNMDPKVRVRRKYNFLRHAGAIYALASYSQWRSEDDVQKAALRAMSYLATNVVRKVDKEPKLLAVWSPPKLVGRKAPLQAKLGGTALGLVAALRMEKIAPGTTPPDTLEKLGRFIEYMQKSDGSFYSKYIPEKGGRNDEFTSLYYPGEAALGLVMLHEFDGEAHWLNNAARALLYLAELRRGKTKVEPDHWALIATSLLLKHGDHLVSPELSAPIVEHAWQIARSMIDGRPRISKSSPLLGSLVRDGRTTPTATRLEGLLAFYHLINQMSDVKRVEQAKRAIHDGIAFLARAQVRSGTFIGGMPRAIRREADQNKAYNDRASEIRIDYVQHALSAMIQYRDLWPLLHQSPQTR